jgi:hypothetical protein
MYLLIHIHIYDHQHPLIFHGFFLFTGKISNSGRYERGTNQLSSKISLMHTFVHCNMQKMPIFDQYNVHYGGII